MHILTEKLEFPEITSANEYDLLAIGGDLNPDRILLAYKSGIFPWFNPGEVIQWWAPNPRFVLFPNELKISKFTKKLLNNNFFEFTENKDFEAVISNCSKIKREGQTDTWITKNMIEAYCSLHEKGLAKSIEVWKNKELVGGLYGIDLGSVFCGESMFSTMSNASKCGFSFFINKYKEKYKVIDCQIFSKYLEQLGAREIPLGEFVEYLGDEEIKNLHFK